MDNRASGWRATCLCELKRELAANTLAIGEIPESGRRSNSDLFHDLRIGDERK